MRKSILTVILFLGMLSGASASIFNFKSESPNDQINNFTFDLYRQVSQTDQNVILSPYSLSTLLSKLTLGAEGQTRSQLLALFKASDGKKINDAFDKAENDLTKNNQ